MSVKTRNSVWVLFAVVCFDLAILSGCDTHGQSVNAAKPAGETQPLFTPLAATLAQQKMCDEQAAKKFRENGHGSYDTYTSHYDPLVNVCYTRVHSFAIGLGISDVVFDAFGGRIYANYTWSNPEHKPVGEVTPSQCEVHIPGKPVEKCTTDTQFNELTEKYFGVTQ
jgi:hypothetical protein